MKRNVKIAVDCLMTLVLLFLMGYQLWGDTAHEWAGAGMFVLFIIHHVLNGGWHKNLFQGQYSLIRWANLVVDVLVLLAMIGMMASGVVLSNHVFAFLPIAGGMGWARLSHLACPHWLFVLLGLHVGLHWSMFPALTRKALKLGPPTKARKVVFTAGALAVAAYGVTVFLRRGFPGVLLLQTQFAFLDFSEPIPRFYLDYLAMMETFVFLAHSLLRILGKASGRTLAKER